MEVEGGTRGQAIICNHCGRSPTRTLKNGAVMQIKEAIGHATAKGFREDQEKYNAATILGWKKLAFTGDQINSGYAIDTILEYFKNNE